MSKMWSAKNAVRAQRLRLIESHVPTVEVDPYAAGYAAARVTAATEFDAERTMLLRLIEAAASIKLTDPEPLATILTETVLRLVEDVVGEASVDQTLLRERALALAAAIHGPDGPVVLRVHPDCVPMLDGLRGDICVCGDPAVDPGQIVMLVGAGAAEDGVTSALVRVRAALGTMS
jgi:flagellar assembly protein FliH